MTAAAPMRSAPPRSQLPFGHDLVALPALRHAPARRGTVLGLQALRHELRDVPPLPGVRRRAGSATAASTETGRRSPATRSVAAGSRSRAIATESESTTAPDRLLEFAPPRLILGFVPVESVAAAAPDGEPLPATLAVAPLPPTLIPSPAPADDGMLWSDLEA